MRIHTIAAAAALTMFGSAALAQDDTPETDALAPPPANCRVEPAQPGSGDTLNLETDKTLSETLDDCNGVLKPPLTGDAGLVEPPPATGNTPIVRPDDLPEQQTPE